MSDASGLEETTAATATDGVPATADAAADAAPIDIGDVAADYVEGLLDACDLDGDIEIEEEGGRTTVVVTAEPGTRPALATSP